MTKKNIHKAAVIKLAAICLLTASLNGCSSRNDVKEATGSVWAPIPGNTAEPLEAVDASADPSVSPEPDSTPADTAESSESKDTSTDTSEYAEASPEPVQSEETAATPSDNAETTTGTVKKDGERFESVIMLEGMEEIVQYEHIRNDTVGIEMDYDYELFVRHSSPDQECLISAYDNPEAPENYLEVTCSKEDAETVAAAISESLSNDYSVIRESRTLDHAGECILLDASADKDGTNMPDQLQAVYVIPAADGCRIARTHYSIEGAEGFGHRFSYIINTLTVISSAP